MGEGQNETPSASVDGRCGCSDQSRKLRGVCREAAGGLHEVQDCGPSLGIAEGAAQGEWAADREAESVAVAHEERT